jgi:hypothetical protein
MSGKVASNLGMRNADSLRLWSSFSIDKKPGGIAPAIVLTN